MHRSNLLSISNPKITISHVSKKKNFSNLILSFTGSLGIEYYPSTQNPRDDGHYHWQIGHWKKKKKEEKGREREKKIAGRTSIVFRISYRFRYDQHQTRFRLDINLCGPTRCIVPFQKVIGSLRACYTHTHTRWRWLWRRNDTRRGWVEGRYRGRERGRGIRLRGEGHEYRWQLRVVLDDQPPSCTRLIYYPRLWLWGIGFVEGPAEGANRKLY